MAAVIQFPMEDYGVNSEFKESDSQESQKNLTDEKSTPTTFTDDRHADEGQPHPE